MVQVLPTGRLLDENSRMVEHLGIGDGLGDQIGEFLPACSTPPRAYPINVDLDFSRPGKPMDNVFIDSFNSRFRQECRNEDWFPSQRMPGKS